MLGMLQEIFQDVVFLPSGASFSTTFLKNCGRGESLGSTTCLNAVVGVSKGMLSVEYSCSNKNCGWGNQGHALCRILLLQQKLWLG